MSYWLGHFSCHLCARVCALLWVGKSAYTPVGVGHGSERLLAAVLLCAARPALL